MHDPFDFDQKRSLENGSMSTQTVLDEKIEWAAIEKSVKDYKKVKRVQNMFLGTSDENKGSKRFLPVIDS